MAEYKVQHRETKGQSINKNERRLSTESTMYMSDQEDGQKEKETCGQCCFKNLCCCFIKESRNDYKIQHYYIDFRYNGLNEIMRAYQNKEEDDIEVATGKTDYKLGLDLFCALEIE